MEAGSSSASTPPGGLLAALCESADLLVPVLRHLTRRDAAALSESSRVLRAAVRDASAHRGLSFQPRLFVAVSRARRLVEVPLDTAAAPTRSWNLCKPPQRRARGGGGGRKPRAPTNWPTSVAFSPWDHRLYANNYSVQGVLRLERDLARPPRSEAARSVFASGKSATAPLACPEGICFSANGFLYVVSLYGTLCCLHPDTGALLHTSQMPDPVIGGAPWPLVPWGMAAWPPPPPERPGLLNGSGSSSGSGGSSSVDAGAAAACGQGGQGSGGAAGGCGTAAGESVKRGESAATPAVVAQVFVAAELDYQASDYTVAPAEAQSDGCIMVADLCSDGSIAAWRRFTPPSVRLPRPSGVTFDAAGDLWCTIIGGGGALVHIAGPGHSQQAAVPPGSELRRVPTAGLFPGCPDAKPWDVAVIPGTAVAGFSGGGGGGGGSSEVLAVTLHTVGSPGAVALLQARDGSLVRLIEGGLLEGEPNMIALQR